MCVSYWVQVSCTHHVALSLTWVGCSSMGTWKVIPPAVLSAWSIVIILLNLEYTWTDQRTGLVGWFCPCVCVCTFAVNVGMFHIWVVGFTEWSQAWKWVDIQMCAHVNSISHLRISSPPPVQRPLLTTLFWVAAETMRIQTRDWCD